MQRLPDNVYSHCSLAKTDDFASMVGTREREREIPGWVVFVCIPAHLLGQLERWTAQGLGGVPRPARKGSEQPEEEEEQRGSVYMCIYIHVHIRMTAVTTAKIAL